MHALLERRSRANFAAWPYLIIKLRSEEQGQLSFKLRQSRPPAVEMGHCRRLVLAATSDYPPSDRLADVPGCLFSARNGEAEAHFVRCDNHARLAFAPQRGCLIAL